MRMQCALKRKYMHRTSSLNLTSWRRVTFQHAHNTLPMVTCTSNKQCFRSRMPPCDAGDTTMSIAATESPDIIIFYAHWHYQQGRITMTYKKWQLLNANKCTVLMNKTYARICLLNFNYTKLSSFQVSQQGSWGCHSAEIWYHVTG